MKGRGVLLGLVRRLRVFLTLLFALGFVFVFTTAEDWPTYLHDIGHGSASGETALSTSNATSLGLSWKFTTGGVVGASPTVADGVVYVGSWDGYEYALDANTGAFKWKTYLGQTNDSVCSPPQLGVESTAAVSPDGSTVYVGGSDPGDKKANPTPSGSQSYFFALNASDGSVAWKVATGPNDPNGGYYNWSSPALYNGFAYLGIASNCDNPLIPGKVIKIDLSSHQVVASTTLVPSGQVGAGVWTSPTIDAATNTVYVTTGTQGVSMSNLTSQPYALAIVAMDLSTLTIKSAWQIPASQAGGDSDWGTTPTFFNDGATPMVEAINKNGFMYAFNRNNPLSAGPVWQSQVAIGGSCPQCGDGSISSGAVGGGGLFEAGGNTLINGASYAGAVREFDPHTGNVLWAHPAPNMVLGALAYDNGLVVDASGSYLEVLDASSGTRLFSFQASAFMYASPSIANGRIYAADTAGNVYSFAPNTTSPPADPSCPTNETCQDVGNPSPAGSESASGGTWSVNAGGSGIGGTSDQFRLISANASGDQQLTAKVASEGATPTTGQGGIIARQSNDPGSPYYGVFVNPNGALSVQYRSAFGEVGGASGTTKTATTVSGISLPVYLAIKRVGDQFRAATSSDGTNYSLVGGSVVSMIMPTSLAYGVAASSGTSGTSWNSTYSSVATGAPTTWLDPTCPGGWSCADIGNPNVPGGQTLSGNSWSIQGGGADIWGTSDQFHYVWQAAPATGGITAHVTSLNNTSAWAKAGLMIRQSSDPAAPFYDVFVTPSNGIAVQYRTTQGGTAQQAVNVSGGTPAYLEVFRSGSTFTAYTSPDGSNWTSIGGSSVSITMSTGALIGLAVNAHNGSTATTAAIDTVTFPTSPPGGSPCPSGWNCADIGNAAPAGNQTLTGSSWSVQGGGADVWGTSDQFHYVWQSQGGSNGGVSAHVTSVTNTNAWSKAGVMFRLSADPGSPYYFLFVTPSNSIDVQYRATQGGSAQHLVGLTGSAPVYLEAYHTGTSFTAYTSTDGSNWSPLAGSTVSLPSLASPLLAGLGLTSHINGTAATATFDTVAFPASPPPPPSSCPSGWSCADVGSAQPAGGQTVSGSTYTIQGGGADIWGTSDQFHYLYRSQSGDGGMSVRVASQGNTNAWAKGGVMYRATADPGSPYYMAFVTPSNGINVQFRPTQGGSSVHFTATAGSAPVYLEVFRSGSVFSAYVSSNGVNWTLIPNSSANLGNMPASALVGVAVTSHAATALSTLVVDSVAFPTAAPSGAGPVCPTNWTCQDIGGAVAVGSQSLSGSTWTVSGGGTDIWGTADHFHYVSETLPGDGSISARVASLTNSNAWAKAGLMVRATNAANAPFFDVVVTPLNGVHVQYRATTGGSAQETGNVTASAAPVYLKITRAGTAFTAYTSADGVTWTPIPNSTVSIAALTGSLMAGMPVTSHATYASCSATIDSLVGFS